MWDFLRKSSLNSSSRDSQSCQQNYYEFNIAFKHLKVRLVKAMVFPVVMYGWMWELDCEESWALKNWCFWTGVLEKTLESPLDWKEIQPVHSEGDQPWDFFGRNDAIAETPVLWPPHAELTHWKRLWCWEGLGAGGEGDNRGWDGWMASLTQWTWVWVNSGSWWWTGRPGVLRFMGSQRVGHDWATELNWTEILNHHRHAGHGLTMTLILAKQEVPQLCPESNSSWEPSDRKETHCMSITKDKSFKMGRDILTLYTH